MTILLLLIIKGMKRVQVKIEKKQPSMRMLHNPLHAFSFGFGSGLLPWAPGTWGTLAALPFFYFMLDLNMQGYLLVLLALTLFSVYTCKYTSDSLGAHDHSSIVCDEVVGYLLVLFFMPHEVLWWLLAFIAFRFFDILKPWPINWLDKNIQGGTGIVIDDIAAALYAILFLYGLAAMLQYNYII